MDLTHHLKLEFNAAGTAFSKWYGLTDEVHQNLENFRALNRNASPADLSSWLDNNGGVLDHDTEPAYRALHADGSLIQHWCKAGLIHREGDLAADIERWADGTKLDIWALEGMPTRIGAPAMIERYPDGSGSDTFYENGDLKKTVRVPPTARVPG
jgi:hypothetical protein